MAQASDWRSTALGYTDLESNHNLWMMLFINANDACDLYAFLGVLLVVFILGWGWNISGVRRESVSPQTNKTKKHKMIGWSAK